MNGRSLPPSPAPLQSARSAGLVYVADRMSGIRRRRTGRSFRYLSQRGHRVRSRAELDRIKRLAIPPAWRDVWICPKPDGHLQATGRDARGRKQHRYHPQWRKVRDEAKYEQMLAFAAALPALRRQIAKDLSTPGLSKRTVIAAVVQLLEKTLIRVGNDEYSRDNNSFGLTTMRNSHVRISRSKLRFRFRGKGGKPHDIAFDDARLARLVRRCRELPGHQLFGYIDREGNVQDIGSTDVNNYLREVTGQDFTAKNFRTWAGTVLAACALAEQKPFQSQNQAKRNILKAVEAVACKLGNTASICRKCYIHPAILDAYLDRTLTPNGSGSSKTSSVSRTDFRGMEMTVLALLKRGARHAPRRAA